MCVCASTRERVRGGGGVGIDGGAAGRGGELQPAKPRPAGSGGAAPRHRDAFVGVIILTLTLCWWSCLLFRAARTPAPPFMAPGAGGGRCFRSSLQKVVPARLWSGVWRSWVWVIQTPVRNTDGNSIGLMMQTGLSGLSGRNGGGGGGQMGAPTSGI